MRFHLRNLFSSVGICASFFLPILAASAAESGSALIVFDASGSMWGRIQGKAKIEIAREVVADLVHKLPEEMELGLMAYGHRRKGDCQDIELLIPVGKVDRAAFVKIVEDILPKGMTPITGALELAAEGLGYKESKATVILVSDGLETCDADPCAAAKKLEELGVDFTAHVIAFDLKPEETEKLRCIADSTGGKFFPASDASSLKDALQMAVSAAAAKEKPKAIEKDELAPQLSAADTAVAGSEIPVSWEVEAVEGDYITIAFKGAKDNENSFFAYTHERQTAPLTTLIKPGEAEIRYLSGITGEVLARRAITLVESVIVLKSPAEVVAGSAVAIEWSGPDHQGDFITIVPKSMKDGDYEQWAYTRNGNPANVTATNSVGAAEIRYMNEQGNVVLARKEISIVKGEISMTAPAAVLAGSKVAIEWTGPNNQGDFITIVPKAKKDGDYEKYAYTSNGSPANVTATYAVGDAEIRYMNEDQNRVLARRPIEITALKITLKAPAEIMAGQPVPIEWTGPNNEGDFLTIVPKGTPNGTYAKWAYCNGGSPSEVIAPDAAGEAEIRYMNEDGNRVLERLVITVKPARD